MLSPCITESQSRPRGSGHIGVKCDNCEDKATHSYGGRGYCKDCWDVCYEEGQRIERRRAEDEWADRLIKERREDEMSQV
jgi:hypothetical protein